LHEVIVKYNGDIAALGFQYEILSESYAILTISEADIPLLRNFTEIEFAEMPKRLSISVNEALDQSCITAVHSERGYDLSGEGVLIAIIDSGIDYRHEDFRNHDGTSRIAYIWDQTIESGQPPLGFLYGAEYTNGQINDALLNPDPYAVVPHQDYIGHGTAVAGIAAGNGRASTGEEIGVAPKATIISVKLGERDNARFARTTEIMRAIKYVYDKASLMNMPLVVNLSYGTNDGAHDGNSLFETYINDMAERWKSVIVVASGNEGAAKHHYQYNLKLGEAIDVTFSVSGKFEELPLYLWKNFSDNFSNEIIAPDGITTGELQHTAIPTLVHLGGTKLIIEYTQPNHYNQNNEIGFLLLSKTAGGEVQQGVWTIRVKGVNVVDGKFDIWLPTVGEVSDKATFLTTSIDTTLTLPSCAEKVITVGGYDIATKGLATFSGRGLTRGDVRIKPDLVAPAVSIKSCRPGGGYGNFTGTSIAAPFVTGSAALMMQWGIVQGKDTYLYGQRIKAFLMKGANRDSTITYPNNGWGYGTLCLKQSMEFLEEFSGIQSSKKIFDSNLQKQIFSQGVKNKWHH
jgi:subtilisin family serine protease